MNLSNSGSFEEMSDIFGRQVGNVTLPVAIAQICNPLTLTDGSGAVPVPKLDQPLKEVLETGVLLEDTVNLNHTIKIYIKSRRM